MVDITLELFPDIRKPHVPSSASVGEYAHVIQFIPQAVVDITPELYPDIRKLMERCQVRN